LTLDERVLNCDAANRLPALQVFGKQLSRAGEESSLNDQGIPEAELMSLFEERSATTSSAVNGWMVHDA
jgi:hypothetical protein